MSIRVLKISLCGAKEVGKSCIAQCLVDQEPYSEYINTIGVDFFALRLPKFGSKLNIWDLGGEPRFREITYSYVEGSDVLLFVYDATSKSTLTEIIMLYKKYQKKKLTFSYAIVVGNTRNSRNYLLSEGEDFATSIGAPHIIVNAINNSGIDELLLSILESCGVEEKQTLSTDSYTRRTPLGINKEIEIDNDQSLKDEIVSECKGCIIL